MNPCLTRHGHDFIRVLLFAFQGRMSSTSGCAGVFQISGWVCASQRYRHARADNPALPRRSKLSSPLWIRRRRHVFAVGPHRLQLRGQKTTTSPSLCAVMHVPKIIALLRDRRGWECNPCWAGLRGRDPVQCDLHFRSHGPFLAQAARRHMRGLSP